VTLPPRAASPEALLKLWDDSGGDAIEERLASLEEMIRSWDWRANTFDEHGVLRPRPTSATGQSTTEAPQPSQPPAPAPRAAIESAFSLVGHTPRHAPRSTKEVVPPDNLTSSPQAPPSVLSPQPAPELTPPSYSQILSALFEPSTSDAKPVAAPAPPVRVPEPTRPSDSAAPSAPSAPSALFEPSTTDAEPVAAPAAGVPVPEPTPLDPAVESQPVAAVAEEEGAPEPSSKRRSKFIPVLVAVLVAISIIVAIILHIDHGHTGGSSPSSTSVTTAGSAPQKTTIPGSSTGLARFTAAARKFDAANVTATHALAAGSTMSVAQVEEGVSPYIAALENFDFTLHFTAWPQTLQIPSEDLMFGNQVLISWLRSISSQTSATLGPWFTELYTLGSRAETADNFFLGDLGLPPTSSYP
jgi:hypothetical protein